MDGYRILFVDDDPDFLIDVMVRFKNIFRVYTISSVEGTLAFLNNKPVNLVLLDVELGVEDGIEGLLRIKKAHPEIDVAMLSGRRDPATVVKAIRAGAIDYLTKPVITEDLEAIVERQAAGVKVRDRYDALIEVQNTNGFRGDVVHKSAAISFVLAQADQLKGYQANVLIVGETGTGKELLARYIHRLEGNPRRPFIAVNCAAIPDNLIEAELFGAEVGAYTGSIRRRVGKFELADGGDIFLDEVGSLKSDMQAKILRVLQEREFCRVGGNEIVRADFRVIAATNELLEEKVDCGEFRMDLYHRLRVIELCMPPLRDRVEDIPALVEYYLKKFSKNGIAKGMSPGAMARFMAYYWPGNVRELANAVQSLVILEPGDCVDESIFPSWLMNGCGKNGARDGAQILPSVESSVGPLKSYVLRAERQYIEYALRTCEGDRSMAARRLNIGRTTLYEKMKELGLM